MRHRSIISFRIAASTFSDAKAGSLLQFF